MMPTAALIFAASFVVVFTLGVQQHNVTADRKLLAFSTSLAIGCATLVQFKLLPGPTTWLDIAGYLLGSACGIVASMWAYPRLFKKRQATAAQRAAPIADSAVRLGETLRLATAIADYAARADIESFCETRQTETGTWWDTAPLEIDEVERGYVANATQYLYLRGHIAHNKAQHELVRFTR